MRASPPLSSADDLARSRPDRGCPDTNAPVVVSAVAAVDLGATSGRVMLGHVGRTELSLHPVARFPNLPVRTVDGLHWNILELYRNVLAGLGAAVRADPSLISAGVDAWAVDYALLRGGRMLGTPFHYRDERTALGVAATHALVAPVDLYAANGLQHLPFTTLHQLAAEDGLLEYADRMLLIPDLIGFWLTGRQVSERTNASTTGLLDVRTGEWDRGLMTRLGLPPRIFPALVDAGTTVGDLLPSVSAELGLPPAHPLRIVAVGSHDTASAVVAVPSSGTDFAFISCGTWGLVGVELDHPVLTEASRTANFTNERGVDGRVRYLHNVMGLWLLSESVRIWERGGESIDLPTLLRQASELADAPRSSELSSPSALAPGPVFDANDPRFLAPGDLPARIGEWFGERGLRGPSDRPEVVLSIIRSLAQAFAAAVRTAAELSGTSVRVVHLVGGGSQNVLLCQLIADLTGLPVLAGPVEATAIGNVLVQARAQGIVSGSLESLRALVTSAFPPQRYDPRTRGS